MRITIKAKISITVMFNPVVDGKVSSIVFKIPASIRWGIETQSVSLIIANWKNN